MNNNCYKFEKIIYNDPIFENTIDATYIIHLEGNGRLEHILNQLEKYHLTRVVYIVYNKGYKKCKKTESIINSARDLVDSYITIFNHAQNLNNILILEDDFIFSDDLLNHVDNVNSFLNKKKDTLFNYYLGVLPFLILPYDGYNYYIRLSAGTHSVIYSKKSREYTLGIDQKTIIDWDQYTAVNYINRYVYYKPLCYQLFPDTENSSQWGIEYNINFICKRLHMFYKILGLDIKAEPGYSIMYIFAKNLHKIIILLIILLIRYIKLLDY